MTISLVVVVCHDTFSPLFLLFAATETSKLSQFNRGLQEEETSAPGLWVCWPHSAQRTGPVPQGVSHSTHSLTQLSHVTSIQSVKHISWIKGKVKIPVFVFFLNNSLLCMWIFYFNKCFAYVRLKCMWFGTWLS